MENRNPEHIIWKRILKEAMDVPPEPPGIVVRLPQDPKKQNANPVPTANSASDTKTFSSFQKERMRMTEVVVACLVLEAGGEGLEGMQAINEVLQNRAKKTGYYEQDKLKALYDVAVKPKQFSCFNAGVDAAVARAKKHPKWTQAIEIMQAAPTDLTHGARFYYANTGANKIKAPSWAKNILAQGGKAVQIGNHVFLYNYKGN